MTKLRFTKMHGLGNDFIVIDATRQPLTLSANDIIQLADRHRGIGFDQLLVVETARAPDTDFFYRIFNSDGGEVAQCGNGARCLARFIADNQLSEKTHFRVATHQSLMELILEESDEVSVNMGVPQFAPVAIPLTIPTEALIYQTQHAGSVIQFSALSIGNPHAIIVTDDLAHAPVNQLGQWLGSQSLFPEGVNVSFAQVCDRQYFNLRVYERGAGETQACGSGAVAAMIALHRQGLIDSEATVHLPGGNLLIRWQGLGHPAWMRGPAVTVFIGEVSIF